MRRTRVVVLERLYRERHLIALEHRPGTLIILGIDSNRDEGRSTERRRTTGADVASLVELRRMLSIAWPKPSWIRRTAGAAVSRIVTRVRRMAGTAVPGVTTSTCIVTRSSAIETDQIRLWFATGQQIWQKRRQIGCRYRSWKLSRNLRLHRTVYVSPLLLQLL